MTRGLPTASGMRLFAIVVVLAGIVHICVTFALPTLTGSRTFRQFLTALPENRLEVLAPIAPANQPLRFMSPEARYAVCRYDTSAGPVAVTVSLPDTGWVMALYSPEGDNIYHVTGSSSRRIALSLLLVPPSEQTIGTAAEAQTATPAAGPVTVATRRGLLLLKAPERGIAYRHETEAELRKSRCGSRRD